MPQLNRTCCYYLLTSGYPNYRILEFNIPLKENADLEPIPNKIIPVKEALIEPATKFMEKLLDLGIIERSYSRFNAFSHFIPKSRPELTKSEFLKSGWDEKDYIAGMIDTEAPQTIRLVNNFK